MQSIAHYPLLLNYFTPMNKYILPVVILITISASCRPQKPSWAEKLAETIMTIHKDSMSVKKYVTHGPAQEKKEQKATGPVTWNYEIGVVLKGFDALYRQTGNKKYLDYMQRIIDHFIGANGDIRTYELVEYNIDHITPGRILLVLYKETKDEKYRKAASLLREQLAWQPRTREGAFWHKLRYPYQMWLDGLFMAQPFLTEYSVMFNEPSNFDDIVNQFVWMEKHSRDGKTGLLYHGWDESRKQRWANPQTGCSPEFWSRAMGWYAMALVDVLDYFPKNHPRRQELISIFQRLAAAVIKYQDNESGAWFQVTDKATSKGNYLEASGSSMFVYALAKGVRHGYIDKSYSNSVAKGFQGLIKNFIEADEAGYSHLVKTCSGAGLGGNPYRDGTFEYYIKEPLRTDDLKGVGPFILSSIEVELMK
jgi:unsaturated rhamnogalacturonyl hydrolase